ncbi:MAG: hypothetical protein KKA60_05260 [Proteobacteria bacterium]|nr:hypothetical protein [Pseudomonadota bacterium]
MENQLFHIDIQDDGQVAVELTDHLMALPTSEALLELKILIDNLETYLKEAKENEENFRDRAKAQVCIEVAEGIIAKVEKSKVGKGKK